MKIFLTMYRNFIALIWWLVVIVIFKVITNFQFHHGLSIVFVSLLIIPPAVLYLFTSIHKRKLIKKKKARKKTYFSRIKQESQNKNMERWLIHPLTTTYGHLDITYQEEKIEMKHPCFSVLFLPNKAILVIHNTRVIYQFYYTHQYDGFSIYDKRYFQYRDTRDLYVAILTKIETLFATPLLYLEGSKCCMLTSMDKTIIYYKKNAHRKGKDKYQNEFIIDVKRIDNKNQTI